MPTLNYKALQDAVLGRRFPPSTQRENAKRWLDTAYADVWAADDWTFKRASQVNLTFTGSATPTMPADFGDAIDLFDENGWVIERLSQEAFEESWASVSAQTGPVSAYMVTNRQITVAPTPGSATYTLSYFRRLSHRTAGSPLVVPGFMSGDSDYPLWDDHHAILIPRAMAIGLMEINDPTHGPLQEEFERQLSRMKEDYVQTRPAQQWARA